ncbi:hypothetical protein DFH06DRAFT_1145584 [Mycena polygramma]|nr:hypothetical protein DFH06DRAFT_1145584 [Mycena polygramma]
MTNARSRLRARSHTVFTIVREMIQQSHWSINIKCGCHNVRRTGSIVKRVVKLIVSKVIFAGLRSAAITLGRREVLARSSRDNCDAFALGADIALAGEPIEPGGGGRGAFQQELAAHRPNKRRKLLTPEPFSAVVPRVAPSTWLGYVHAMAPESLEDYVEQGGVGVRDREAWYRADTATLLPLLLGIGEVESYQRGKPPASMQRKRKTQQIGGCLKALRSKIANFQPSGDVLEVSRSGRDADIISTLHKTKQRLIFVFSANFRAPCTLLGL